ncbi:Hypothetical predicted protein [Olea europaea subsp. europaea]|uniref:Senescence regulator n=1 Tax=Olea europaea subsp. europaea TaxID=158383 RepID=A0A8S0QNL1_OLEEU|nr:Hypothetical predicted protein [Olea europaea subsp. europaea]CAA2969264.1 Hypothetical predicted protein [Olea europaea subsp. europaea]
MAEEFQEFEVIFQENVENEADDDCNFLVHLNSREFPRNIKGKRKKLKKKRNSFPLSIPENVSGNSWLRYVDSDFFDDDIGDDGEMVPPHVIIGRRLAGKMMEFSCRLKGRNLMEVRDSILRMTGFLET